MLNRRTGEKCVKLSETEIGGSEIYLFSLRFGDIVRFSSFLSGFLVADQTY